MTHLKLEAAAQAGYSRRTLNKLLTYLGQQRRRLVLLLDRFERLPTR